MARRFPVRGARKRTQWTIYNLFMKKGAATDVKDAVAEPTPVPDVTPMPPILPLKREWREEVLEGAAGARPQEADRSDAALAALRAGPDRAGSHRGRGDGHHAPARASADRFRGDVPGAGQRGRAGAGPSGGEPGQSRLGPPQLQ